MAQSPTIAISRKKTDDVDWTSPIRSIIAQSYGESPDSYAAECAALQRCRQDAVKGAGSDMTARDLLYKYFGQLELLELRFSEIKVTFPWYDAFTGKLTTQTSLAYEKASIIFQMAATHSAIASTQNRSDPEGLKRSFHYFKTSAGMLTYINENFLHAPSTDLSRDVVKLLVAIMLAQATEVFFEKLIDERKSGAAFNAKVAAQAAFLYNGLVEDVKEFYGKNIFDRNWVTLLQIKAKYFAALTQYHQYLADTSKAKYGDALARISLSSTLSRESHKLAQSFSTYFIPSITPEIPADGGSAILSLTKSLSTLTAEKLAEAQKENDLIYNAVPVDEATLQAVDKLVVASPISIQEVYASAEVQKVIGPDMFGKLIPLSVHKSASIYSEEKAKLARAEAAKADEADVNLSTGLESLGLPGGLQKWKDLVAGAGEGSGGGAAILPRELEVWAEEIEDAGGVGGVDALLNQLGAPRAAVSEQLAAAGRELESESRLCEQMRIKYEHEWTQDPSAPLTRSLRSELKSLSDSLASASHTDEQVIKLWNAARPDIALLLSGPENLERYFAEQEQGHGRRESSSLLDLGEEGGLGEDERELAEIMEQVNGIDEALGRLNKIKRERGEVLKDLKEKIQTDDVSHLLLVNHRGHSSEQTVFAAELEKFRPYQSRLATAIAHQEQTFDELAKMWRALKSGRGKAWVKKAEGIEKKRGHLIGRFVHARETWGQVREGVSKGLEFYRQLGDLAKPLIRSIEEFVRPRNAEREQLAAQLETRRRLASPPSSNAAPPPPRPSYDLSGSMSSMSISSPPLPPPPPPPSTTSWDMPPSRPPPPPTSVYSSNPAPSALPPPPPAQRQTSYGSIPPPPPPSQATSSMYGSLPPPPQRPQYASPPPSAPSTDPYSSLFSSTPGLSSQFSLGSSAPPPPPPSNSYQTQPQTQSQPQGYYTGATSPPPPPPQQPAYGGQYQQYSQPPPPPQQQQQQGYYSQPPPPPPGQYGQMPPPPQQQQQQQPQQGYYTSQPPQQQQQQQPPQQQGYYGQYGGQQYGQGGR